MLKEQIESIKKELTRLILDNAEIIEELKNKIQSNIDISANWGKNWIGKWANDSYNHYNNFIKPTQGGHLKVNKEDIVEFIESKSKLSIKELSKSVYDVLKKHEDFRNHLITELSIIKGIDGLNYEEEILDNVENLNWGITPKDYVQQYKPQSIITRNPEFVLNKGLQTPPHLSVDGDLISLFSIIAAIEDFQKNTKRLIRQIEIKTQSSINRITEFVNGPSMIYTLIERFHIVATQLKDRHAKRDTIEIQDEYDVQDLLNALLKIDFDDVRPEEYTPSYAGSSTRVDFLLKNEKIIIEVKKTRVGLDDREIGNQLILDSQHYKAHPDCKHLICFVYDPENRIKNPRGLENDLNKQTSDDLIVEVFIRP